MRAWWVVAGTVVLAGCGGGSDRPPPEPLPTSSPSEAVFYVPGMT